MANKKRTVIDVESEAALEVVEMEKRQEELQKSEREFKEKAIAQVFELAGKIKATALFEAQSRVMKLLNLKQVKDAKAYRETFGMTWEQFCDHVGEDRRRIDEELIDLKPFKAEFLAKFVSGFGVEINKVKYLGEAISANSAEIRDNAIVYDGETIPLTPEHRDDIQALLERLEESYKAQLEDKTTTIKTKDKLIKAKEELLNKQEKEISKYERAAKKKGLSPEEDAFLQDMDNLRTTFDGYLLQIDPERMAELKEDSATPRMRAAYLTTIDYIKKQILVYADTSIEMHGDIVMCSENAWQQPE